MDTLHQGLFDRKLSFQISMELLALCDIHADLQAEQMPVDLNQLIPKAEMPSQLFIIMLPCIELISHQITIRTKLTRCTLPLQQFIAASPLVIFARF